MCAAAVALADGRTSVVHGRMDGNLIETPRGTNGFGYDPIFVPSDVARGETGEARTSAELTDSAKDAISHRGKALRALVPVLRELLPATR
jgi:XTP/dITP diphosphohydrolase